MRDDARRLVSVAENPREEEALGSVHESGTPPKVADLRSRLARGRRRMIRELLATTRAGQAPDDDRVTRTSLGVLRVTGSRTELKTVLARQVGTRSHCLFCRTGTFSRERIQKKYTCTYCRTCNRLKSRVLNTPVVSEPTSRPREFCEDCGRRTARIPGGACVNAASHPKPQWCAPCGQRTRHHPETRQCLRAGHKHAA